MTDTIKKSRNLPFDVNAPANQQFTRMGDKIQKIINTGLAVPFPILVLVEGEKDFYQVNLKGQADAKGLATLRDVHTVYPPKPIIDHHLNMYPNGRCVSYAMDVVGALANVNPAMGGVTVKVTFNPNTNKVSAKIISV